MVNVSSSQKADQVINWLRSYANKRINSRLIDERRCIPPYIVLDFGNQGLLGMQVEAKHGGLLALNNCDAVRVIEQLAGIDLTLATFVVINNFLGIRPIERYGTDHLKSDLLPLLATGRELASFALTEAIAGSNPRAMAAQAISNQQGGWQLQGTKIWIGSASWAGAINVFVKLFDQNSKALGNTGFTLRQGTPELKHGKEAVTMGMRGIVQNPVHLDGVSVDPSNLLGEIGSGMTVAQDAMLFTRLAIGAKSVGAMKHCAQIMLRYADRRSIGTGGLLNNPVTIVRLSNLTAAITAVETLVYRIAQLLDQGVSIPLEAYIACKTSGPEFLWQAADHLIQLLGGRGYIETNIAPQILRDARIFRIFEGPTETLNMFMGSSLIRPRKELVYFFSHHLQAVAIWEDLKTKVQAIQERWSKISAPFSDLNSSRSWSFSLVGELASYAILLAVVQEKFKLQPSTQLTHAIDWLEAQFEDIFRKAMSGLSITSVLPSIDQTKELISSYSVAIGELQQTLLGEDDQLDDLLGL